MIFTGFHWSRASDLVTDVASTQSLWSAPLPQAILYLNQYRLTNVKMSSENYEQCKLTL